MDRAFTYIVQFYSTVHAGALLEILQKLLVIDRDGPKTGPIFSAIQKFIEAAVSVSDPSQMDGVTQVNFCLLSSCTQALALSLAITK